MKKKKCKHTLPTVLTGVHLMVGSTMYQYCTKCGVELVAKWSEKKRKK